MKKYAHTKIRNYHFVYDFERSLVGYAYKISKKEMEELYDWEETVTIGKSTYLIVEWVGLSQTNWSNRELRNNYLELWIDDIEEELAYLIEDAKREFCF